MTLTMSEETAFWPRRALATTETISGADVTFAEASQPWIARTQSVRDRWLRSSPSFSESLIEAQLDSLASLAHNWDSYGAPELETALLERVRALVTTVIQQGVQVPSLIPTSAGAVVLEWRSGDKHLDIELDPDGDDLVTLEWEEMSLEYEGNFEHLSGADLDSVKQALAELVSQTDNSD